jgi:hypothetical protein
MKAALVVAFSFKSIVFLITKSTLSTSDESDDSEDN